MARLVVVTGANRGLGYEVTRQFVSNGDKVLLTSRTQEAGAAAAKKIEETTESQATVAVFGLDISSTESVDKFVELIKEDYDQQLDILVNNAGVLDNPWTQEAYDRAINVNVRCPIELTQKLAPHMAENGRVVMVSSGLAMTIPEESGYHKLKEAKTLEDLYAIKFLPEDNVQSIFAPAYSVSKLMLNMATKILSKSEALTKRGITIDAVDPGWCRTDMGTQQATRSAEEGATDIFNAANVDPPTSGMFRGWKGGSIAL